MKDGEGADHLADADEEEGGEGRGHQEAVQWRHQVVLDLNTQLSCIQERKVELVPSAEHQDVSRAHRAVLKQKVCCCFEKNTQTHSVEFCFNVHLASGQKCQNSDLNNHLVRNLQ